MSNVKRHHVSRQAGSVIMCCRHTCSVAEDIPRADEVRALVKDLWDSRIAKLRKSVNHMISEQETFGKVSVVIG